MSPPWPTVKLVSVPAEAPSVLPLSEDGVDASWVIAERSSVSGSGVVEPFVSARLSASVPPVVTLPAPLKVTFPPPVAVTPAMLVVGVTLQVLAAVFWKVRVTGTALPCES